MPLADATSAFTGPFKPCWAPSADQLLPFHSAMLIVSPLPADVKLPPACTFLPFTASASTKPCVPEPSAAQLLPSHLATPVAGLPPAIVIYPPKYKSLPDTASACTSLLTPEPSGVQLVPSHLAM